MDFPKTFTDKKGREWTVNIGLAALSRLRSAGIPLEEFVPMPSAKFSKAPPDMMELTDLLHGSISGIRAVNVILTPELARLKIDDEDFLDSIDDEELMATVSRSLYQAICDFFQKSPLRQSLVKRAWKDGKAVTAAAARSLARVMEKEDATSASRIAAMEQQINANIDIEMAKMPPALPEPGKNSAGSTPE